MLIDEADVYIKRRDDNITMNAVVGVFLRVLEYFNGLLFLTTNRVGRHRRSHRPPAASPSSASTRPAATTAARSGA